MAQEQKNRAVATLAPLRPEHRLAVVYDRASTERQRDNYARADAARLTALAPQHGFSLVEVRQEIKSGESLRNRPVMQRILKEVEEGVVGAVICQDFTRLSRDEDGIDGRVMRQVLRDAGCVVITPEKVYDFSLDVDDDMADIGFLIGKIQKRQNVRALVRGMREKALQGKMLPPTPRLGYTWSAVDEQGHKAPGATLQVDADGAETVRAIFDMYEGMSARLVALRLNEQGRLFPSRAKGPQPFRANDILRIVTNPFYTGMVSWGKNVQSRHLKGFQPVERHEPQWQIVSFEQFNRVQELVKQRHWTPPRSVGSPFLFSGVLACAMCGAATVGQRQNKTRYGETVEWRFYQCRAYHQKGKTACVGICISEDVAREAVENFLAKALTEGLDMRRYLREAASEMASEDSRAASLQAEIQEADLGLRRLADAVAAGALDLDAARAKTLELREKKERATKRLASLRSGNVLGAELRRAIALVERDLPAVLKGMEKEKFRELMRLVLKRVAVRAVGPWNRRTGEVVSYTFTPEFQEFWLTHSNGLVELRGVEPLASSMPLKRSPN